MTFDTRALTDPDVKLTKRDRSGEERFVIKDVKEVDFDYAWDLQRLLINCPNLRAAIDTIPERHMFVFHYFASSLLHIHRTSLSPNARKDVLKSALEGLADLHDRRIIHTGNSSYH